MGDFENHDDCLKHSNFYKKYGEYYIERIKIGEIFGKIYKSNEIENDQINKDEKSFSGELGLFENGLKGGSESKKKIKNNSKIKNTILRSKIMEEIAEAH